MSVYRWGTPSVTPCAGDDPRRPATPTPRLPVPDVRVLPRHDYCLKECAQCGVDTPYEVCDECQLANRDARREELERLGELEDAERWEADHDG